MWHCGIEIMWHVGHLVLWKVTEHDNDNNDGFPPKNLNLQNFKVKIFLRIRERKIKKDLNGTKNGLEGTSPPPINGVTGRKFLDS